MSKHFSPPLSVPGSPRIPSVQPSLSPALSLAYHRGVRLPRRWTHDFTNGKLPDPQNRIPQGLGCCERSYVLSYQSLGKFLLSLLFFFLPRRNVTEGAVPMRLLSSSSSSLLLLFIYTGASDLANKRLV